MSSISIQPSYPIFNDIDGQPLESGYIWIGVTNLDPQTNPVTVYWDAALTILAPQPIRTISGYPSRNGSPGRLYVNGDYSIRVIDRKGGLVYSSPALTDRYGSFNAEDVIYNPPFTGGVATTVETELAKAINVKNFGVVGNGITDDTTPLQQAINAAIATTGILHVSPGNFIASSLSINGSLTIIGCGPYGLIKQAASTSSNLINITGIGTNVLFYNVTFDGNFSNQSAQSYNCIIHATADGSPSITDVFSLAVQNCEFRNPAYSSVRVQGDNLDTTRELAWIINNRFLNGADGVDNVGQDYIPRDIAIDDSVEAWIENNIFESDTAPVNFGRAAIVAQQTQTTTERLTELHIVGNRINRRGCNVSQPIGAIDLYIWATNCVVRDNVIKNSYASAIRWKQNGARLTVVNNKVDTLLSTAGAAFAGNNPTAGTARDLCIVEGNQINEWDGGTVGVIVTEGYTTPPDDYSDGIVIRNNQLKNCSGFQIQVSNTKAATISGNQIYPLYGTVAILASAYNDGLVRISDNFIGASQSYAILTLFANLATCDFVVTNNTIMSCTEVYACLLKGRRVVFSGNYISDSIGGVELDTVTDATVCNNFFKALSGIAVLVDGVTNFSAFGNSAVGITTGILYNQAVTLKRDDGNTWNWASTTPAAGYYNVGDVVYNNAPTAGGTIGSVCTIAGAPGTWKTFGAISA